MQPVLVIMAAGMGSRYGGLKQMDPVDPAGNLIIDFSIFDALKAGFEEVIFIIKEELEGDFRSAIGDRISHHARVRYAFQRLDALPEGFQVPQGRVKPWGTTHALLCAQEAIAGRPFCAINADDYYGPTAYQRIHQYLCSPRPQGEHALVAWQLANTLTDHGSVARGICAVEDEHLTHIVERKAIIRQGDGDNPSSIVDIFGSKTTTIPKIQGDPGVRLACRDPQGQPLTAQEVYAKVNPSVVTVVSEQSEGASIGTGVIMTSDGYIITNAHVISGGKSCWVALDTGVTYEVNLVGFDEEEDLAVLKADPQNPLPAAEFGNSDLVQVGDTAYAIGNPLGVELRGTMTSGIISAVNRAVEVDGKTMTLLQTSAALNNGNSGGPLINEYGQVIGINTLKMSTTDSTEATVEGLGFALPISSVSFVVNDLIANGHYRGAPSLGITVTTVERDGGGTQVQVMEVSAGSGAADAGIRAGDVILAADGQAVSVTSDLLTARRGHIIGDTVTLTILRDGQQFDVEVTLRSNRSFG